MSRSRQPAGRAGARPAIPGVVLTRRVPRPPDEGSWWDWPAATGFYFYSPDIILCHPDCWPLLRRVLGLVGRLHVGT